jgi:hypothetical protein
MTIHYTADELEYTKKDRTDGKIGCRKAWHLKMNMMHEQFLENHDSLQ